MSNSAKRDNDVADGEADEESGYEQEFLLGGLEKLVIVRPEDVWPDDDPFMLTLY